MDTSDLLGEKSIHDQFLHSFPKVFILLIRRILPGFTQLHFARNELSQCRQNEETYALEVARVSRTASQSRLDLPPKSHG